MKSHIIEKIQSGGNGTTKASAEEMYASVVGAIADVIRATGEARVPELGTFKVKMRAGRLGRNPQTGEEVSVPAKKALTFKQGRGFAL